MSNYQLIRTAILNKQQITAMYQGHYREMCPHAIGRKRGREQALFFQFAGSSSKGLPPEGAWRCIVIDQLTDVMIRDGEWQSGTNHSRPQNCVDEIDVEVAY